MHWASSTQCWLWDQGFDLTALIWTMVTGERGSNIAWIDARKCRGPWKQAGPLLARKRNSDPLIERELKGSNTTDKYKEKLKKKKSSYLPPPLGSIFHFHIKGISQCSDTIIKLQMSLKTGVDPSETSISEANVSSQIVVAAAAAAKLLQSCPTLCDPIDGSPPGSPIPGILQARTLEWVAISFSNAWKWKVKVKSLSRVRLVATPWTTAYQAPPSMGFSRQEYWSGVRSNQMTKKKVCCLHKACGQGSELREET